MLKKVQIKIVLISFLIGIIIISGFGIFFEITLNQINQGVETEKIQTAEQLSQIIIQYMKTTNIALIIGIILLTILSIIFGIYISKIIITPLEKIMKSIQKISNIEKSDTKKVENPKKEINIVEEFGEITKELKENINEISTQKKQVETILLHMTDGIIAFNMEGEIILKNPAATRLLKTLPEDDTFEKIFSKLQVDINMEKIIYLENLTSSEQRIKIDDEYVNLFFAPYKDEDNRPNGIVVMVQDITEHVKLDNMQKEFVADVSHELKTPITSIMGYADTLLEGEYDKETQEKFLNVIASEARRMARLVTDLLTLSRYDSNRNKLEKSIFDLGELVKRCQDKLQIEIDKKKHKVKCFVTADVPPVYADSYDIERVVLNILTNSIKYTPEGGEIKIYVGFVYNDAYIKIFDNGIGIPEEDLTRIFERFYRVDKARSREQGGTGLGLSIAKEILDKNGGNIDIKSVVGEGTEVVIKLPTVQEEN